MTRNWKVIGLKRSQQPCPPSGPHQPGLMGASEEGVAPGCAHASHRCPGVCPCVPSGASESSGGAGRPCALLVGK